jgi:hypothetical protein
MSKLYCVIMTAVLMIGSRSDVIGQHPVVFNVLDSDGAVFNGRNLEPFDELQQGDTVFVAKDGYLGLISNYYHGIELHGDTTFIIPSFQGIWLDESLERPPLRKLHLEDRLARGGAVEHDMQYLEFLWPDKWRHMPGEKPCFNWRLVGYDQGDGESYALSVSDIFDEMTVPVDTVTSTMLQLSLDTLPNLFEAMSTGGAFAFKVSALNQGGTSFESGLTFHVVQNYPTVFMSRVNPCIVSNAVEAVAMALYYEYNFDTFTRETADFYSLASSLSSRDVYREIERHFLRRKNWRFRERE